MNRKHCRPFTQALTFLFVAVFAAGSPTAKGAGPLDAPLAADAPLETFVRELIAITPGVGKFPGPRPAEPGRQGPTDAPKAPFRVARHEVPQDLYERVIGKNPSRWKGPRNAVEEVSHDEAVEFCRRLTDLLRERKLLTAAERVDLPTEIEWEYCCRAGTGSAYSFGDDPIRLGNFAWFQGNAAGNDPPVGAKKPNPWGLYDVHGYLWEWCKAPDGTEERGRAARGGAWTSPPEQCRSSSRRFLPREHRGDDVGFRCVVRGAAAP